MAVCVEFIENNTSLGETQSSLGELDLGAGFWRALLWLAKCRPLQLTLRCEIMINSEADPAGFWWIECGDGYVSSIIGIVLPPLWFPAMLKGSLAPSCKNGWVRYIPLSRLMDWDLRCKSLANEWRLFLPPINSHKQQARGGWWRRVLG